MSQAERIATSDNQPAVNDAPRSSNAPLIAVFVAVALVAVGWAAYDQGQQTAAVGGTEAVPAATQNATTTPPDVVAQQAGTNDSNTTIPAPSDAAATSSAPSEIPKSSATDTAAMNTGAAPPLVVKANSAAKKRSVAHAARSSRPVAVEPRNRAVALLDHPNPTYPSSALRERQQGTVLVLAQVDVQGRVSDARVIQRSGSFVLDHAATNEVRKWQFQPALKNGNRVVASVEVPVSYRLQQ